MAITPVSINGAIQRLDDMKTLKQHEESKPQVDQQNISHEVAKKQELKYTTVQETNKSDQLDKKYDAKDKGSNEYKKQKNKKKSNKGQLEDENDMGTVTEKKSHFDITI